jgi:putative spermidine/putrescine transport system substrate-binding protein
VKGASFGPDIAKYIAYPESKMDAMGLFAADWTYINPRRPGWLEKYRPLNSPRRPGRDPRRCG